MVDDILGDHALLIANLLRLLAFLIIIGAVYDFIKAWDERARKVWDERACKEASQETGGPWGSRAQSKSQEETGDGGI
jgi:hypothetical protein